MAFPTTSPSIARALAERNYNDPTPVQHAVLAEHASDADLLVSAQTGSGKTVAYGLAIAPTLLGSDDVLPRAGSPLGLIIAPTRELALQVQRELTWLYEHTSARIVACVGGMDTRSEARNLEAGAHIVVGTPGRLRDHLERRRLDVSGLKAVVLDEADEMLDLGFRDDLEFILETTPKARRTLLFSATLPKAIQTMARSYQRDAKRIEVLGNEEGHADIDYRAVRVMPREIDHAVVNILRFVESPSALVFCNTRATVRHLHGVLLERGFAAVSLSGELGQNERNHALQALRDGRARVCVATDVAARGIDLPNLDLVIHAELPHDPEVLQHRSGRTGRAGRKGVSVLLVPAPRRRRAEQLMAVAGVAPEWSGPPLPEEIRELDQERLLQDPLLTAESTEDDLAMARALIAQRSPEEIAAALARVYRSRLPAPEEVTDPGFNRDGRNENTARVPTRDGPSARSGERAPRSAGWDENASYVLFRLSIGRKHNADPRRILPMLCRRGEITRNEIGSIRIFESETKVEIAQDVAERFAIATRAKDSDNVTIEPLAGSANRDETRTEDARPPRPKYRDGDKPATGKPFEKKPPFDKKPYGKKPHDERPPGEKPKFAGKFKSGGKGGPGGKPFRKKPDTVS
jgi:ATP-dependent RNA helicase DeaD